MMPNDNDIPTRIMLLEHSHNELKDAIVSIKDSQKEISQSLSRLVLLEERHSETRESLKRAFEAIEKNSASLSIIERDMPQLIEVRNLIMRSVVGVLSVVGLAIIGLIMKVGA